MKLTSIEVKGKTFEVDVHQRDGRFSTEHGGDTVYATTLDELKTKLAGQISRSKVKLNIPFVRWETDKYNNGRKSRLVRGVVTGMHASNRNILVRFDGQKSTEQESGYNSEKHVRPEVADELLRLGAARDKANEEYDEFVREHSFDAREEIRKLLGTEAEEE